MAMGQPVVRPAAVADSTAMGEVHVAAWQVGYQGLLPSQLLDNLAVERSAANWTTALGQNEPDPQGESSSLVAEVDGRVMGICSYGPYRQVDGEPAPLDLCELWMLNVHPDAWGSGVAQALMAAALDGLRHERPEMRAALWVLEGNARGRRFYEKEGWAADGGTKLDTFAGQEVVEVRYSRDL